MVARVSYKLRQLLMLRHEPKEEPHRFYASFRVSLDCRLLCLSHPGHITPNFPLAFLNLKDP